MDAQLPKEAKGFVHEVVSALKRGRRQSTATARVQALLHRVTARAKKEKVAHVATSVILTSGEKHDLAGAISHLVGHDITLSCVVDTSIVGGIRVQVGDWIVDTTLKSQLRELSSYLTQ